MRPTEPQNDAAPLKAGLVLVTGGAGFIGSHLVEALAAGGARVRVLDDLSTGSLDNLAGVLPGGRVEFIGGGIEDEAALRKALEGVEVIYHLAGMVSVPESLADPARCQKLNDLAVFNLYRAAAEAGVRRVVFSSSSAVYGEIEPPHHEELCPRPNTPYAIYKLLGEHYGIYFQEFQSLETVVLRYFNVYGPRQRPDSPDSGVISIFMDSLLKGRPPHIFGTGEQTRDFVYVADVVRANLAAAGAFALDGRPFNIGSGRAVSINELYRTLAQLAEKPDLAPVYCDSRPGDILHSFGPVDRAANYLKIIPSVSLAEGLDRTWKWFAQASAENHNRLDI
ncbi:NAD-dependent epimerase/dehydratase family protein [Deltaproteobacteria bacterium OttesenSCG-928-K17]|nr:NAD-dependent epimerase/dehydratase family protein [Deltaproteobacteria bacterium OttesenSCG-928-K17]